MVAPCSGNMTSLVDQAEHGQHNMLIFRAAIFHVPYRLHGCHSLYVIGGNRTEGGHEWYGTLVS